MSGHPDKPEETEPTVVEAVSVEDLEAEARSGVEYDDDLLAVESQVQERDANFGSVDSYSAPQAPGGGYGAPADDSYGSPSSPPEDSYGAPQAPPEDSYGAPQAPPEDSYGSPEAPPQSYGAPIPVPLPVKVRPSSIVIPQGPPRPAPPKRPAYRPPPQAPKRPAYRPPPPPQKRPPPPKPSYKPPPPKPQYKPPPPKQQYKPKPQYKPPPPPPKQQYKPKPQYKPPPPKQQYKPAKPQYKPPPPPPKQQQNYQSKPVPQPTYSKPAQQQQQDEVWPKPQGEMPKITSLDVTCEKNLMKVYVEFDKPFYGIIFSKGHYSDVNCVHLPAGLGRTNAKFDVSINSCGTTGNTENGLYGYGADSGSGTYFENTIVIQYDPQVQEVWDQARKLRCTWHDQYEKSVTFRPFPVDMLDVVRADFAGDNVGCWMQIQVS